MTKKFYKNEKFQTWFFSILYFLMTVAIVITGCFTFKKVYYLPIVVSGTSMWPTLSGAKWSTQFGDLGDGKFYTPRNSYGIADIHPSSVNSLHRFDVIATYYPSAWGTDEDYKIKRVWGFPGETLNLSYSEDAYTFTVSKDEVEIYSITSEKLAPHTQEYEFQHQESDGSYTIINHTLSFQVHTFVLEHKTFNVSYSTPAKAPEGSRRSLINHKLGDNEYFVMGDNWSECGSTDSYDYLSPSDAKLTKEYLQGRIICINSYVTYVNGEVIDEHAIEKRYDF